MSSRSEPAADPGLLDTVLSTMPAGVVVRAVDGRVLRTNPALERMLGRSAEELAGPDYWELTHPDDPPGDDDSRRELLGGERRIVTRIRRLMHADGHYIWARVSAAALRDRDGTVRGTVAVVEDVTAEHEAQEALVRQARIYHTMARNIPGSAVLLFDRELRCLAADGGELLATLGYEPEALEGRTVAELARPDMRASVEALYGSALAGNSAEMETSRNGRTLRTRVAPVWDDESISGGIALVQDVTEERGQAEDVRRAKVLFEVTIANIRDGVVVLDREHRVLYANRAYAELFDFDPAKLVGSTRADFLAHVAPRILDSAAFTRHIHEQQQGRAGASAEFIVTRPERRSVRRTVAPLELPDGPAQLVVWQDISAEKQLLEEHQQQALTDALTGVPNRRAAELELRKAAAHSQRSSMELSVALFDVDHFKRVNDEHGHAVGDEVLKRIATTLNAQKRLTDTVARWGGEEFLAVLPVALAGAVHFCERARAEIERTPMLNAGRITISVGVARLEPGEDIASLLKRADERLYAAKATGRNRVVSGPT